MMDRSREEQQVLADEARDEGNLVSARRAAAAGAIVAGSVQAQALAEGLLKTERRIERLRRTAHTLDSAMTGAMEVANSTVDALHSVRDILSLCAHLDAVLVFPPAAAHSVGTRVRPYLKKTPHRPLY